MKTELSQDLIQKLLNKGAEIFIVGGSVRDELLGISSKSKDLDLLVTSMDIEELCQVLKLHGTIDIVGKSFGVIKFKQFNSDEVIDISVPRIDNKTGIGHKDFQVVIGKEVTLRQDMMRRDFTINALAKNLVTSEILDVTGRGITDIKNKIIRMVSEDSMREDALRQLRAIQFSARFGFHIEPHTIHNIIENRHLIHNISKDRFVEEFKKLFTKSTNPSKGIQQFHFSGLMDELIPNLKLKNINLTAIDKLSKDKFESFLTLLLLSLGVTNIVKFLKDFRFPTKTVILVKETVEFILKGDNSDKSLVLLNNDKKSSDELFGVIDSIFNATGSNFSVTGRLRELREKGVPTCIKELHVTGDDLMWEGFSGPAIGKRLRELLLDNLTN